MLVYALAALHIALDARPRRDARRDDPGGVVIFASVWVIGGCLAFWTTDGGEFTNAFTYGGNFIAQYPIDIYCDLAAPVPRATSSRSRSSATSRRSTSSTSPTRSACRACSSSRRRSSRSLAAAVAGPSGAFAVRHYRSAGG